MKNLLNAAIVISLLASCSGGETVKSGAQKTAPVPVKPQAELSPGKWNKGIKVPFKTNEGTEYVKVHIFPPKNYAPGNGTRVLILLHEFNGRGTDWEENTSVQKTASELNFILVCPDMGTTLYESGFFPETKNRWGKIPGSVFTGEVLIDFIRRSYGEALSREKTGIIGVATGARGAILNAVLYPDRFGAAAGIAGDYDPLSMTRDQRLEAVYGKYEDHKERWEQKDNILKLSRNFQNIPLFLWHGEKDYLVPKEQTMVLAMQLRIHQRQTGGYDITYTMKKNFSRGWKYWKAAAEEAIIFFDAKLPKQ